LTIAFLTGLLVGALGKVWPWREAITFRTNSAGEQVPLLEKVLSPQSFEMVTGQSSQLLLAIVMMVVGFMLVMGMEQLPKKMK
ncbi:MAG: undecaprenyl phosphate translocase family protein, partial [Enterovibrio sp.]